MVEFLINPNNNKVRFKFDGDNFDFFLDICKSSHIAYKGNGYWQPNKDQLRSFIYNAQKYEIFFVPKVIKDILYIPSELILERNKFDKELLSVPPYGDYQLEDIHKGIQQNRLAFYLEQGMGKTYILINILNYYFSTNKISNVLILCPDEGIYSWRRELLKFNSIGLDDTTIKVVTSEDRYPFESKPKIIIMTYITFRVLSDYLYKKLTGKRSNKYRKLMLPIENWIDKEGVFVLDESHHINNMEARQTKLIHQYKKFFHYRYVLTGTPEPNGVKGLYSQMSFLDDCLTPLSYYDWLDDHAILGTQFSEKGVREYKPDKVKEFIDSTNIYVIRRKADDYLDLPEQIVKKVYSRLNKKHKKVYQAFITHTLNIIKEENDGILYTKEVERQFPYLIQVIDNPNLLKGKIDPSSKELYDLVNNWRFEYHSKLDSINSIIEDGLSKNEKIIIWDYHPKNLDDLQSYYKNKYKKYTFPKVHGLMKLSSKDKDDIVEEFKINKNQPILFASSKMLSTNRNIVEAHIAIFFSRDWSFLDWDQARKRIKRIGQDQRTYIYPTIIEDSIETLWDQRIDQKEQIHDHLFESKTLPFDVWKDIFNGNFDINKKNRNLLL